MKRGNRAVEESKGQGQRLGRRLRKAEGRGWKLQSRHHKPGEPTARLSNATCLVSFPINTYLGQHCDPIGTELSNAGRDILMYEGSH